jgi:hypothetical protein
MHSSTKATNGYHLLATIVWRAQAEGTVLEYGGGSPQNLEIHPGASASLFGIRDYFFF